MPKEGKGKKEREMESHPSTTWYGSKLVERTKSIEFLEILSISLPSSQSYPFYLFQADILFFKFLFLFFFLCLAFRHFFLRIEIQFLEMAGYELVE